MTTENLTLLCVILGVVALLLAITISVEIYKNNKRYKLEQERLNSKPKLNIKEDQNIKYVDEENEDLEKTKAKMELANLRERLRREQEEKRKLLEINTNLSKQKVETNENLEITKKMPVIKEHNINNINISKEEIKRQQLQAVEEAKKEIRKIVNEEISKRVIEKQKLRDNKSYRLDEALEKVRAVNSNNTIDPTIIRPSSNVTNNNININLAKEEQDDEEDAIISYAELKNAQSFGYTDEEMNNYVDEKDAIISIQELEKLYQESNKIEVQNNSSNNKVELNKEENSFQFINKVHSDQDLILEQTSELQKLNEEIKKTNEFLIALKDLKKNLQ
jgi:hypothetical protein